MEITNCFVIMPFSASDTHTEKEWENIFTNLFKPAWGKFAIECCRANIKRGSITKDIIERLYSSSIVFADLTDSNPNVMYELGVRHSFKRPSIMVKQKHSVIPFDVNDYNVFEYENTTQGLQDLQFHIQNVLEDIKKHPNKSDNPVWDFLYAGNFIREYEMGLKNIKRLQSLKNEFEQNLVFSLEFLDGIKDIKLPKDNVELQTFKWDFDEKTELIRKMEYYFPNIQSDALNHLRVYRYVDFLEDEMLIFDKINILCRWCHFYTSNIGSYELDEVEKNRIEEMVDLTRKGIVFVDQRISELDEK